MGIGIDIEQIGRFRNLSNTFIKKVFTIEEVNECMDRKDYPESLAARFCVKEAVIKASSETLNYYDIVIYTEKDGTLKVKTKKGNFEISISHSGGIAIAIAISK